MRSKNQIARSYLLEADKIAREMIDTLDENRFDRLMGKAVTIRHHIWVAIELIDGESLKEGE